MAWLGRLLGRKAEVAPVNQPDVEQPSKVHWLSENSNPWRVPVLDLRAYTLTAAAVSKIQEHAVNSVSFGQDDGTGFIGMEPPESRTITVGLRYPIDGMLADGSIFLPNGMDQKWAIFLHRNRILFVRSWTRRVQAIADVRIEGDSAVITSLHGTFGAGEEDPAFSVRMLDYLVRTHALGLEHPVPLPRGLDATPDKAAVWCFATSGNMAHFATTHELKDPSPSVPLRTYSLLHIAAARGNLERVQAQLDAGVPVDLIGRDGRMPLHWSFIGGNVEVHRLLLSRGSAVDVRSMEGATPLMEVVQRKRLDQAAFLLDQGAEPNAADDRGFTALHRSAELGFLDLVQLLLKRGADPNPVAEGHTPRSLAEGKGHTAIVKTLSASQRDSSS